MSSKGLTAEILSKQLCLNHEYSITLFIYFVYGWTLPMANDG